MTLNQTLSRFQHTFCTPPSSTASSFANLTRMGYLRCRRAPAFWIWVRVSSSRCSPRLTCMAFKFRAQVLCSSPTPCMGLQTVLFLPDLHGFRGQISGFRVQQDPVSKSEGLQSMEHQP